MLKSISFTLALVFGLLSVGCGDDGDDDDDASDARIERKCTDMCEHISEAPLSGCGHSDAADLETCVPECAAHLNPKEAGEDPEATEGELDCAITAADCDTWEACGDFL